MIYDQASLNQAANFALLEWPDDINISDTPPAQYWPKMRQRFEKDAEAWNRMSELHALPEGWELLPYEEFLRQRRILMAQIIHRGFEALA